MLHYLMFVLLVYGGFVMHTMQSAFAFGSLPYLLYVNFYKQVDRFTAMR